MTGGGGKFFLQKCLYCTSLNFFFLKLYSCLFNNILITYR